VTERVLRGIERLGAGFDSLPSPEPLTKRELEIVGMMAAGYSNREIAKACFVAEGTIKNHISNILSKLGVRDRTRAVLRALHLGLI
jgi:ATP/maltotriose-dependent transcriptional regulator MalT